MSQVVRVYYSFTETQATARGEVTAASFGSDLISDKHLATDRDYLRRCSGLWYHQQVVERCRRGGDLSVHGNP